MNDQIDPNAPPSAPLWRRFRAFLWTAGKVVAVLTIVAASLSSIWTDRIIRQNAAALAETTDAAAPSTSDQLRSVISELRTLNGVVTAITVQDGVYFNKGLLAKIAYDVSDTQVNMSRLLDEDGDNVYGLTKAGTPKDLCPGTDSEDSPNTNGCDEDQVRSACGTLEWTDNTAAKIRFKGCDRLADSDQKGIAFVCDAKKVEAAEGQAAPANSYSYESCVTELPSAS